VAERVQHNVISPIAELVRPSNVRRGKKKGKKKLDGANGTGPLSITVFLLAFYAQDLEMKKKKGGKKGLEKRERGDWSSQERSFGRVLFSRRWLLIAINGGGEGGLLFEKKEGEKLNGVAHPKKVSPMKKGSLPISSPFTGWARERHRKKGEGKKNRRGGRDEESDAVPARSERRGVHVSRSGRGGEGKIVIAKEYLRTCS